MTKFQRFGAVFSGLMSILFAVLIIVYSKDSYPIILLILSLGFVISGINMLTYYFTMAINMVGGKRILYRGVLFVDFAIMTASLTDVPKYYVLMYLAVIHGFSGLVEILRVRETRSFGAKNWKLKFFHGAMNITMALACIIFARKTNTASLIYGIGLFYSGIIRIISAFRKSTFVYIQ